MDFKTYHSIIALLKELTQNHTHVRQRLYASTLICFRKVHVFIIFYVFSKTDSIK